MTWDPWPFVGCEGVYNTTQEYINISHPSITQHQSVLSVGYKHRHYTFPNSCKMSDSNANNDEYSAFFYGNPPHSAL